MKAVVLMLSLAALALPSPLLAGPELDAAPRHRHPGRRAHQAARHLRARDRAAGHGGPGLRVRSRSRASTRRVGAGSMLATPRAWRDEQIVKVTHAGLREAAGPARPGQGIRYSFRELTQHEGFLKAADSGPREAAQGPRGQARSDRARDLDPLRHALGHGRASSPARRCASCRTRPTPRAAWFSLADLDKIEAPPVQRVKTLTAALVVAYKDGDRASVRPRPRPCGKRLAELRAGVYPAAKDPAHRGPLQPLEAVPRCLDLLSARLPRAARELPAGARPGWLGRDGLRARRLSRPRLRDVRCG